MATTTSNKISIIGLGRLGLCTALCFERKGYDILGVDLFPEYCEKINNKTLSSPEPQVEEFLKASKNLKATTKLDEGLEWSDMIFILVDTPTGVSEKSYDHSKLSRVLSQIMICCTVLPGYIATVARYLMKDCENVSISYNPEFIAQEVLIGEGSKEAGNRLEEIYLKVVDNKPRVCRMAPESNMIADIADSTPGADKFDVLGAVGQDSRVGTKCLKPGYGFGGPCFPRDNRALYWYAKSVGVDALLSTATDQYNKVHAQTMVEGMLKENKDLYVFEDVTYKENCAVPIIEESQKLIVGKLLRDAGKKVLIRDRADVIKEVEREYGSLFQYEIVSKK